MFSSFEYTSYQEKLLPLLRELLAEPHLTQRKLQTIVRKHPKDEHSVFTKDMVVQAYRGLAGTAGLPQYDEEFLRKIQMKPVRTLSGVTPVTVLTKPFPCPGKCIFCPNDIRMPKSYLADEPGAQRAERNNFDPYLQTYNRLVAFHNIGHQTAKVEFIILGGTWSYYPEKYQIWFIKECFRALNDFAEASDNRPQIEARYEEMQATLVNQSAESKHKFVPSNSPQKNQEQLKEYTVHGEKLDKTYNQVISELYVAPERLGGFDQYQAATWEELEVQQRKNETARLRNVGLVIETRPDNISPEEVLRIRRLGCTKTQIGFQSLNDDVLEKNKRGHTVDATRRAVGLLRQAGFKIHAHWMPNLYGSSVADDKNDYELLFHDDDFKPDELKIYPCSLIESAELMQNYQRGEWKPYTESELSDVLTYCLSHTPEYCRLTRVVRDIPSTDIVTGNKKTNFRQIAEKKLEDSGQQSKDIRAREIREIQVKQSDLFLDEVHYSTSVSQEIFLQFVLKDDPAKKIAGFLRLSLPTVQNFVEELRDCAIIREVHVYGQSMNFGVKEEGRAQHLGIGSKLIERAKQLAVENGFASLAVISAVGTREYYRKRGFLDKNLYQVASL